MSQRPPKLPERDSEPVTIQPAQRRSPAPTETSPPMEPVRWGCLGAGGCLLLVVTVLFAGAVLTAGTVGGGWLLVRGAVGSVFGAGEPPRASVTASQTIVNQVRPLGQLVSTSAQVAKADITVNVQQGRFNACSHSANHVASGTIRAGVDMYEITEDSIQYNAASDTYTITVPAPIITSCSIDTIDQYERQLAVPTCGVDWDDARQIAQFRALQEFRDDALEGGLLDTAEREADFALSSFVSALTGSNVEIVFDDTAMTLDERGANCDPQAPRDWQIDSETGNWVRVR